MPTKAQENETISRIADRAIRVAEMQGVHHYRKLDLVISISKAHEERPIDLAGLLAADIGDFGHDVFGIDKYMSRETGKMTDCFVPRYARG
jgi:hypothetical protein